MSILIKEHENGLAELVLNRPKVLNSLNTDMVEKLKDALKGWENDPKIQAVLMHSDGNRAFCAGGDIKMLYEARLSEENKEIARDFFEKEYELDLLIAEYNKPIISLMHGIIMGGGVGLAQGASHRIVTEKTKWAMPEMNIGFFPDVGAAYFLNKAPSVIGKYLALSSETISGEDAIYIGAADYYLESDQLDAFLSELKQVNLHLETEYKLNEVINQFTLNEIKSEIEKKHKLIDYHFNYETIEEIVDSLGSSSDGFAHETKETLLSKSPVSLKVTLEQLIRGKGRSLKACLETDKVIASNFLYHDDFYEGVRSVVIDKDLNPQYKYSSLESVTKDKVDSFFID